MKLSDRTLALLANFQRINPSIVLTKGTSIATRSTGIGDGGEIMAWAKIDEEIPMDFGIYDLSTFINTVGMMGEGTELEFEENYVMIKNGNTSFRYHRTPTSLIEDSPMGVRAKRSTEPIFSITTDILKKIESLCRINSLPLLSISGKEGKIYLKGYSEEGDNLLNSELCEYTGEEFSTKVKWSHLKMMPTDYDVHVKQDGYIRFISKDDKLDYVVGILAGD